jgi:hypothetical protein
MHGENIYPEVVWHFSLGSPVLFIQSKPVVVPSSGEHPATILGQCHHTQMVDTNQVTEHLVD